jgi:hypothetical protein
METQLLFPVLGCSHQSTELLLKSTYLTRTLLSSVHCIGCMVRSM